MSKTSSLRRVRRGRGLKGDRIIRCLQIMGRDQGRRSRGSDSVLGWPDMRQLRREEQERPGRDLTPAPDPVDSSRAGWSSPQAEGPTQRVSLPGEASSPALQPLPPGGSRAQPQSPFSGEEFSSTPGLLFHSCPARVWWTRLGIGKPLSFESLHDSLGARGHVHRLFFIPLN